MTPPRPTAPTAAELRANFAHDYCPVHTMCHNGTRGPCDWLAELDALVAAVQAEALEDAATLAEIYVGLSARAARVPRAIRAMVSK